MRKPAANTTARGYGHAHQQLRKQWATTVATGRVICARPGCGQPILPGQAWDLGHDDHDRTRYRGPEHRRCNRAAAARKGNRSRARARRRTPSQPTKITRLRW